MKEVVYCETEKEWEFVNSKLPEQYKLSNEYFNKYLYRYKAISAGGARETRWGVAKWYEQNGYTVYTFNEWLIKRNISIIQNEGMKEKMLDVLTKTYNNPILRQTTIPLFMSNPGLGKSSIIKEFAESLGVTMLKTTLSQRMPNEVVGGLMPSIEKRVWMALDNEHLNDLKDGDIWFIDEVFNGTLKQTLDALLNFIEDRVLPSGKPLAKIMIVGASNPQGLINITPQIKQRFDRIDLKFHADEYKEYLLKKYGMPETISKNLCILIGKETFENSDWNYKTPRSFEKALNQIGCNLKSQFDDILLPYLTEKIQLPINENNDYSFNGLKGGDEIAYLEILKASVQFYNINYDKTNNINKN